MARKGGDVKRHDNDKVSVRLWEAGEWRREGEHRSLRVISLAVISAQRSGLGICRGKVSCFTEILSKSRYCQWYVTSFRLYAGMIVVAPLTDIFFLLGKMAGARTTSYALYS